MAFVGSTWERAFQGYDLRGTSLWSPGVLDLLGYGFPKLRIPLKGDIGVIRGDIYIYICSVQGSGFPKLRVPCEVPIVWGFVPRIVTCSNGV